MRISWAPTLIAAFAGLAIGACKAPAPVGPGAPAATLASPAPSPAPSPTLPASPATPSPAPTATSKATGKGRLSVDKETVDLGEIAQGEKATHTFNLKNVGTDVVHIARAKGS